MARKMQEKGMIDTFGAGGGGQPFRAPAGPKLNRQGRTTGPVEKLGPDPDRRSEAEEGFRVAPSGMGTMMEPAVKIKPGTTRHFGLKKFNKGGMVKGHCREYGK